MKKLLATLVLIITHIFVCVHVMVQGDVAGMMEILLPAWTSFLTVVEEDSVTMGVAILFTIGVLVALRLINKMNVKRGRYGE